MTEEGEQKPELPRDRFTEEMEAAFRGNRDARPTGPPERRPPNAVGKWFKRGKLWDDVFTRTVANVLSLTLIGAFAAAAGLIKLDRQGWAALTLFGGAALTLIVINVAPVRYLKHQWLRWSIGFLLMVAVAWIAVMLLGPTNAPPADDACTDPFLFAC